MQVESLRFHRTLLVAASLAAATLSCSRGTPPAPAPPSVTVAHPVVQTVVEWDEYTGRLAAVDSVEVRSRVNGYLQSIHFSDGALVTAGALLFIIDPRPYDAVLARARADLALAEARLDLARKDLTRAEVLLKSRAISQEEAETRAAQLHQNEASVAGARAAVDAAALDVEFTRVTAPVSGRVGRHLVTEGNLVIGGGTSNATLLTTIVSLDPINCYFDADEQSVLKYSRLGLRRQAAELARRAESGRDRDRRRGRLSASRLDGLRRQSDRSRHRHDARPRGRAEPRPAAQPGAVRARSGSPAAAPTRQCWSRTRRSGRDQATEASSGSSTARTARSIAR